MNRKYVWTISNFRYDKTIMKKVGEQKIHPNDFKPGCKIWRELAGEYKNRLNDLKIEMQKIIEVRNSRWKENRFKRFQTRDTRNLTKIVGEDKNIFAQFQTSKATKFTKIVGEHETIFERFQI